MQIKSRKYFKLIYSLMFLGLGCSTPNSEYTPPENSDLDGINLGNFDSKKVKKSYILICDESIILKSNEDFGSFEMVNSRFNNHSNENMLFFDNFKSPADSVSVYKDSCKVNSDNLGYFGRINCNHKKSTNANSAFRNNQIQESLTPEDDLEDRNVKIIGTESFVAEYKKIENKLPRSNEYEFTLLKSDSYSKFKMHLCILDTTIEENENETKKLKEGEIDNVKITFQNNKATVKTVSYYKQDSTQIRPIRIELENDYIFMDGNFEVFKQGKSIKLKPDNSALIDFLILTSVYENNTKNMASMYFPDKFTRMYKIDDYYLELSQKGLIKKCNLQTNLSLYYTNVFLTELIEGVNKKLSGK
jgi:hypothetical protein